jgi:hypothetical protein
VEEWMNEVILGSRGVAERTQGNRGRGVSRGRKFLLIFLALETDQCWKQQDHVASFVHDGRSAVSAAHFTRQFMPASLFAAVIPSQVMMTTREIDIFFVENGGPLKRCPWTADRDGPISVGNWNGGFGIGWRTGKTSYRGFFGTCCSGNIWRREASRD